MHDSRLLSGHTKLKEYESSEKLASRARSKVAPELVLASCFRGPIMSPTVMSQSSLVTTGALRFATGCMSSAVNISCTHGHGHVDMDIDMEMEQ
jgi:hypothetical protein